ncbi:MAG: BsuBI/PstI family type II restriction endonuclease [Gaiellaceae bacterium]
MPLPSVPDTRRRLELLFPDGVPDRNRLTREIAAKTILTFLFVGAIGDPDLDGVRLLRPSMVTWMDDASLSRFDDPRFVAGWHAAAKRRQSDLRHFLADEGVGWERWYAENNRESIRDEVIRPLHERYGAVLRRGGLAASAASPALTLASDFAAVFEQPLSQAEIDRRAAAWRSAHLSPAEQARLAALRRLDSESDQAVIVGLPGRGDRRLPPGLSSALTTSVIEMMAPRLLDQPYVLAICHSRDPVAVEDARELERVGLTLDPALALPDVLILDAATGRFWFVEVVVTGGAINERRRGDLLAWATDRGVAPEQCRFVSAYRSRSEQIFRSTVGELAWETLVWFGDEPDRIFRLDQLPSSP